MAKNAGRINNCFGFNKKSLHCKRDWWLNKDFPSFMPPSHYGARRFLMWKLALKNLQQRRVLWYRVKQTPFCGCVWVVLCSSIDRSTYVHRLIGTVLEGVSAYKLLSWLSHHSSVWKITCAVRCAQHAVPRGSLKNFPYHELYFTWKTLSRRVS